MSGGCLDGVCGCLTVSGSYLGVSGRCLGEYRCHINHKQLNRSCHIKLLPFLPVTNLGQKEHIRGGCEKKFWQDPLIPPPYLWVRVSVTHWVSDVFETIQVIQVIQVIQDIQVIQVIQVIQNIQVIQVIDSMQVIDSIQRRWPEWRHLVDNFATYASDSTWWENL